MKDSLIKTTINVKDTNIGVMRVKNVDYISLTDLARYADNENPSNVIIHWMSTKTAYNYISLWEEINNKNFNFTESREIKNNELIKSSFTMSPLKWIRRTNAIGIISKGGKYSIGTYAHPDIAFEFASWLSPEFKLYLITEFERLKKNEMYQQKIEWKANRLLSKVNYLIHTDAISKKIVPTLSDRQKRLVYADEADVLNVALFGMTAKEWRDNNTELSKNGNIRDYTDILHLIILSNLENLNASLIENNISQRDRLILLNDTARKQLNLLINNKNIEKLENLKY